MTRHWLLKSNPDVWDVWEWWEDGQGELDSWTLSRRLDQIKAGDDFALWVTGAESGVYAHGKVVGEPAGPGMVGGGYWLTPPEKPVWDVELSTDDYLFDAPIYKAELAADPQFADALILRVPATANPVPLTDSQWEALRRRFRTSRRSSRVPVGEPVVTGRRVGLPPDNIVVHTEAQERKRAFREAQLLREFASAHPNPLVRRRVRFPDDDWIECDAYDEADDLLIEAKATADRADVRMAIGQLMDYRRHIGSDPDLALLVPEAPIDDLKELLESLRIRVIVRTKTGFAAD